MIMQISASMRDKNLDRKLNVLHSNRQINAAERCRNSTLTPHLPPPLPTPGIQFFVKFGSFEVPYSHKFATDSYETSRVYLIRHGKLIYGGVFCLYKKYEKLLIL